MMKKYRFHAIELIADSFEMHDISFFVKGYDDCEQLLAGFSVDSGPNVIIRYISTDNDNDVAVRIYGLITNTPNEKRNRIIEACNVLNHKIRYLKFYLDDDGDINIEYDFPVYTTDEIVGKIAFEIFARMMHILNSHFDIFIKAIFTDEALDIHDNSSHIEFMQKLEELQKMIETRMREEDDTSDDMMPADT